MKLLSISSHAPNRVVDRALVLLAQGQAEQAAALLQEWLRSTPQDAAAWHALGGVVLANGMPEAALSCVGKALKLAVEPHFHITLGQALLALGHAEQARAALHVAILETPRDPRAHQAMAEALEALGRTAHAEQALRNAVQLRPLEAGRQLALAAFLGRHGQVAQALEVSQLAVALAPQEAFVQNQHALLLERAGKLAEAAPYFGAVAGALPENAAALANYGAALFAQGAFEDARLVLLKSVESAPEKAETYNNLGLAHMALGALPDAVQVLAQAHALNEQDARLATNYGTALADMGQATQAEALFRQVLAAPRGSAQDRARAEFNLGTLLLAQGRFEEGWRAFEARQHLLPSGPAQGLPQWSGQSQAAPVLLYCEQGLGDCLQFLRYVAQVAQRAPVLLVVPAVALALVEKLVGGCHEHVVRVCTPEEAAQSCDATSACSLLSLPFLLKQDAPFAWLPQWHIRPLPEQHSGQVRVGVCWAGNPTYRFDRRRSLAVEAFGPLCQIPGLVVQSLQQGVQDLPHGIAPLPEGDLLHTARIIAGLDAVVTVDTAIAHLAGVLGKPTWLLNRFGGDWRWSAGSTLCPQNGRVFSLWYPSIQVVTQPEPGEGVTPWQAPLEDVASGLRKLMKKGA